MFLKFVQDLGMYSQGEFDKIFAEGALGGALAGMAIASIVFMFLIIFGSYIYLSFAYMAFAKKTRYSNPGFAWIPIIGPALISAKAAKMPAWPVWLLVLFWVPFINNIAILVFAIFFLVWTWKLFEAVGKPGWWAILCLISPLNYIFLGIAAWSGSSKKIPEKVKTKKKKSKKR